VGLKELLRMEQSMSSLDVASGYAEELVRRERRVTGKLDTAMHNVGIQAGVSKWTVWGLFHRRRKTTSDGVVGKLRGALIRQLEAEVRHLEHELTILKATGGHHSDHEILAVVASLAKARQTLGLDPS
jgi:hypothetical protein